MSQETLTWLNQNVLVGFTERRGNAWHYRASEQGDQPNHYPQAIPVEDVIRRLFHWHAIEVPVEFKVPSTMEEFTVLGADGAPMQYRYAPDRKLVVADDDFTVLGVFKDGYQPHQYDEWLVDTVETVLDDSLSIGSAGLLRNRAVAWVQVEVPDNVETPEGVVFRPNLLACTSFDGSLSTTFKRTVTNVVCDNTMANGLREGGQQYKVKHSRNSKARIVDARDALSIVYSTADDFASEVKRLCEWSVTNDDWRRVLDALVPIDGLEGAAKTRADNRRTRLASLYRHDERCAPWQGTAFGVVQTFNTYAHHLAPVRGAERAERNMLDALKGATEQNDGRVLAALGGVQSR